MSTPNDAVASGPEPKVLGPFEPPADFRFEEEFEADPPRPLPAELNRGRYAVRRRKTVSFLLFGAAFLTACGQMPVVKLWGLYFLPFQYLTWVGLACGAFGVVAFLDSLRRGGPYKYVRYGVPLVARVRSLVLRPTLIHNGQPTSYRIFAGIEYPDPETGELRTVETSSNEIQEPKALTTTYHVGDYATAVYLPGKPEKTLRLYGFLDLKPGLGLVRRDGAAEAGVLAVFILTVMLFGFFGVLFWNIYAYGKFQPIEMTRSQWAPPFVAGSVVLGGGLIALVVWQQLRNRRQREARNAEAVARGKPVEVAAGKEGLFGANGLFLVLVIIAGSLGLGGSTALCWAYTANALLDRSPAQIRPVQIDQMIMVTHKAIFREYKIQYHFLGDPKKRDYLSTPFEMIRFQHDLAAAEVHRGRFGWPWVKTLHPVRQRPPAGPPAPAQP